VKASVAIAGTSTGPDTVQFDGGLHDSRQRVSGRIEAEARSASSSSDGQSSQMGQSFNVTVNIAEYSSPEEPQVLVGAFEKAGSQGLFNALEKMSSKGRISMTGTLGYDISFVRQIPTANGRKIRVLTNRLIGIGEAWVNGRTRDYNISALEFDLVAENDKSTGVLLPACQFKIDEKTKELVIENYQNPWKLANILIAPTISCTSTA